MRKVFAILLIIFPFLPAALCGLLTVSFNSSVVQRDFWVDALDNPDLYDAVAQTVAAEVANEAIDTPAGRVNAAALSAGMRDILSSTYIRDQVLTNVNAIFDALEGDSRQINLAIDIAPIKQTLLGEGRNTFASAYANALPQCATSGAASTTSALPLCVPSGTSAEAMIEEIGTSVAGFAESLPSVIQVGEPIDITSDVTGLTGPLFNSALASLSLGALGLAVLFWLMVAFVAAENVRQFTRWLAYALLVPVLVMLFIGTAVSTFGNAIVFAENMTINGQPATPEFSNAVQDVGNTFASRFAGGFNNSALVGGLVMIGLFIISFILPVPRRDLQYVDVLPMEKPKRDSRDTEKPKRY